MQAGQAVFGEAARAPGWASSAFTFLHLEAIRARCADGDVLGVAGATALSGALVASGGAGERITSTTLQARRSIGSIATGATDCTGLFTDPTIFVEAPHASRAFRRRNALQAASSTGVAGAPVIIGAWAARVTCGNVGAGVTTRLATGADFSRKIELLLTFVADPGVGFIAADASQIARDQRPHELDHPAFELIAAGSRARSTPLLAGHAAAAVIVQVVSWPAHLADTGIVTLADLAPSGALFALAIDCGIPFNAFKADRLYII